MAYYTKEIVGQEDFYNRFSLTQWVTIDNNNTDGYLSNGGAIFEFKCQIDKVDEVLFQAIKYLSRLRVKGIAVHKNIILISLNDEIAYCYDSKDFLDEIEKIYIGASSKHNEIFATHIQPIVVHYNEPVGMKKLLDVLDVEHPKYTKINIDLHCVVGWANRFYRETHKSKIEFFEELRKPALFEQYINPWKGKEDDFKFIMDCLNDLRNRRELGAFYTPKLFALKAVELVRKAIDRVPVNHNCTNPNCKYRVEGEKAHRHYIIVDRCAGTGVLQEVLSDEELKHTIVATYELKEWVVLNMLIGDKVRTIIPPTHNHEKGLLIGGDALACKVYPEVEEYIEDESCSVILYENPPYTEAGGRSFYDQSSKDNTWKESIVCKEMKKEIEGVASNEKSNVFIWSAFKYYLTKEYDSYIVFSPIKYWKTHHLVNREFIDGFYCNRDHFGTAGKSTVSVMLWGTKREMLSELPLLPAYDIVDNNVTEICKIKIKRSYNTLAWLYDRRIDVTDTVGLVCMTDGKEILQENYRTGFSVKPLDNENIIAYLATHGFSPNSQGRVLTRVGMANGHGFFIREDNFMKKLPLFVSACFPENKWYRKDVYSKTSDGGKLFEEDTEFLKSCLIYTCLSPINKCLSFYGTNGKTYINELCFDENTLASRELKKYKLTNIEKLLISTWEVLFEEAKKCEEYNKEFKYGVYQIQRDMKEKKEYQIDKNTKQIIIDPKTKKPLEKPKYPILNGKFNPLKKLLEEYFSLIIEPKLFQYELIK